MNDIRVNDEPKHLVLNPTVYHHAIAAKTPDGNEQVEELIIPMALSGVFSYFEARKPTLEQWTEAHSDWCIPLTYDAPEWEPRELELNEQESAMIDAGGLTVERDTGTWNQASVSRMIASLSKDRVLETPAAVLADALQSHVHIASRSVKAVTTHKKHWKVGPAALAKRWGIGIGTARKTIDATTQYVVRSTANPTLSRRFATNDKLLRFRRLNCMMYTDTLKAKKKSWYRKNLYGQVYTTDFGWVGFYPMKTKSQVHETLVELAHDKGVPYKFVMDNAREQTMGEFRRKARSYGCSIRQLPTYSAWLNDSEAGVFELKKGGARAMVSTGSPRVLWDHCYEWRAKVTSHTARSHYKLHGQVPETILTGQTCDISNLAEYGWYSWVKFFSFGAKEEVLGRWLGPAGDEVGSAMTSKILMKNCCIYMTATLRPLTQQEWDNPDERRQREAFDKEIHRRLGQPMTEADVVTIDPDAVTPVYTPYADSDEGKHKHELDADEIHRPMADTETDNLVEDEDTPAIQDAYVGATVDIQHKGEKRTARVKERARNEDGQFVGEANDNPLLDTRRYIVEFPDGEVSEYTANLIAESMIAQCDDHGYDVRLLDSIIDHKSDGNAVSDADRYFYNRGRQYHKKTTAGWKLCVQWKGGLTTWETLADLKESYPVQVAEYAKSVGIQGEPAFAWWTEHVLKKRDRIIAKVTKRFNKVTHKFGIEIPTSVEHAYEIDRRNGNKDWTNAIEKEMLNVRIAFKTLSDDDQVPPGYQQMKCHMIFDVKLGEGFRKKARMVAGGHTVECPPHMTYSSVVSRETVRIALTLAALNGLEVKASDIQNAYLTAPCSEKIWTILGPEFGVDAGKRAIIVRALYGLPASGASFMSHLAECMRHLQYRRCSADHDLWYKEDVHPDGERYYRYILLYCDDCLSIGLDAAEQLQKLDYYFQMKPGSIGDPDIYLGNKLKLATLPSGVVCWGLSSSKYVNEAISQLEHSLQNEQKHLGKKLKKNVKSPWPSGYEAELDSSEELNANDANFYQHLVGVLQWILELGRVDAIVNVAECPDKS
jgi:hypothetical protein